MNAEQLPSTLDNTEIYRLMYQTLFGVRFSAVVKAEGGARTVEVTAGEGYLAVVNFGGLGRGVNPSENTIAEVDTLQFKGADLTARNLVLTQNGDDLVVSFEGVAATGAILRNFQLDNLDNLSQSTGAAVNLGNLVFDGQSSVQDSFDVFNAEWDLEQIFNRNSVTFLNELDNSVRGFDHSDDVINTQGGDDRSFGLSGNDLLRGGAGYDYLDGGRGSDTLVGGTDADVFVLARGSGSDTVQDFSLLEGDKFALSGGLTFGRLSILQGTGADANNALIRAGSTSELLATVVSVQASSLTQANFLLTA